MIQEIQIQILKNASLVTEPFIEVNGKTNLDMGMEYRYGLMELNTKDFGKIIKLMEEENLVM